MIVAGIDPGKTGALGLLHSDGYGEIFDVPMVTLRGKPQPAWSEWWTLWRNALILGAPDMIVIEDVSSRPAQGSVSTFKFGRTLGFVHAAACSISVPIHFVTPSVWKGKMGLLNSDKNASREMVRTRFPKLAAQMARVKDDGRAEAILLAAYGRQFL